MKKIKWLTLRLFVVISGITAALVMMALTEVLGAIGLIIEQGGF